MSCWRDDLSPLEADVVAAVQRHERGIDGHLIGADPREVCEDLPEDDEDVMTTLQRLYTSGVLERDLTGRYCLPEF